MAIELPQNIDLDNQEFLNAWSLIQHTNQSVFLTGKAGTGKSTFLRYICANTKKNYVILAPTGIAAVNVGGVTMHSFFKMPFKPLLPDDPEFSPRNIRKTLRFPRDKVKLIKELDMIIIDEISMVRSDMIDFADRVLRVYSGNMREPFGGKQLLLVGDIFQLEPVVTADMKDILRRYYKSFFFFNAYAFKEIKLVPIELRKIYRQTDNLFVSLLDRVRINRATQQDLAAINARCIPNYKSDSEKFMMTLATRRDTVDMINETHMDALKTPEYIFNGEIDGTFPSQNLPTALELHIKKDAQVIFIRNDKEGRWINGTLGRVCNVSEDSLSVELENGSVYNVEPEQWENMQYAYDEEKKVVVEHVLGTFKQYPLKPAWALTVHKSQGLTFSNIMIDFTGGAFSSGQTYVALSRCTSLEGIVMLKPIDERDIIVNNQIVEFSRYFNNEALINDAMSKARANEYYNTAVKAFDANDFRRAISHLTEAIKIKNVIGEPLMQRFACVKLSKFNKLTAEIKQLENVIDAQRKLLYDLAMEYVVMGKEGMSMNNVVSEDEVGYNSAGYDVIAIKAAMANFNKALKLWPECIDAFICKAELLEKIDEREEALELLEKALMIDKEHYGALYSYGLMLMKDNKKTVEAIKVFKKAVKVDKTAPQPHDMLVTLYERLGLDEFADQHSEKAKKLRERLSKKKKNNKL